MFGAAIGLPKMKRTPSAGSFRWDYLVAAATSATQLGPCASRKCVIHPVTAVLLGSMLGALALGCYKLDLGQTLATWTRIAAPVHHAHASERPVRAAGFP